MGGRKTPNLWERACAVLLHKLEATELLDAHRMALEEAQNWILGYCNLGEMPDGLLYAWAGMAAEAAEAKTFRQEDTLSGVRMGDVELRFRDEPAFSLLAKRYSQELNRFRRMAT